MSETAAPATTEAPATAAPATTGTPPAAEAAAAVTHDTPPPSLLGTPDAPAATEGEAAKTDEPAAPAVPEKYEFTPPEIDGKPVTIDAGALTAFEATAKALGLTQEQFQGVTAAGAARIAEMASAPYRAWHAQQAEWQATINADPDIGGDKLAPSLAHAARALDAFGGSELRQALILTGAGNNPAVVKAFVQIGRAMGEAEGLSTGKPAAAAKSRNPEQAARDFYNSGGGNYPAVTA